MASNCFGSEPIQKAKRWDRKEKEKVSADMLYVVHNYDISMEGTDRQDQDVNKYRISMRTKNWWWPLFSWRIDVTIHNVWLLFRASHPRWSLLEFRRYVLRCLLEINRTARYNQDVAVPKMSIPKELRLGEQQHLVDDDPLKKAHNLPHILIFRLDSLLSNVKIPVLRLFFYFVMKRYFIIITCHYKIFCKNTCFVVIFPFVMENNLFAIIYNPKLHSTFFFLVGPFMPKGWISTPSKFMGSQ